MGLLKALEMGYVKSNTGRKYKNYKPEPVNRVRFVICFGKKDVVVPASILSAPILFKYGRRNQRLVSGPASCYNNKYLLYMPLGNPFRLKGKKLDGQVDPMTQEESLKNLISNHQRRLQKLREIQALHGISVDPKILLEIEDIEAEIEKLGKELEAVVESPQLPVSMPGDDADHPSQETVLEPGFSQTVSIPPALTWEEVLRLSQKQTDRILPGIQSTPKSLGDSTAEVYVRRVAVEANLKLFLDSPAGGLILIGDSGGGKTSLLRQWTLDLLAAGHAVFIYDCSGSISSNIDLEIARDLSLDDVDKLLPTLTHISEVAGQESRQLIFIFDAINEFRGSDHEDTTVFLKRIDALVGHLPDQNVHLVLSCNKATWRQLERQGALKLFWSRYFQPAGEEEALLYLDRFTPEELETAYKRYQKSFNLQTPLAKLPVELHEQLRDPLLLRILAETYQNREVITYRNLASDIFQRYYELRVRTRSDQVFLDDLAAEMLRQRRSSLLIDTLLHQENLREQILSNESDSSYRRMLDRDILIEVAGDLHQGDMIRFKYQRVAGYVLAGYLLRRAEANLKIITTLVREAAKFPLAWDIAQTMLLLSKDPAIFTNLAQSTDIETRELVVEGLVALHVEEPAAAIDLLKQLLQMDSREARRTGLKTAYHLGHGARDIFLWAAIKGTPALREVTRDALYLIWRTDPDFVFNLLQELVARIGLNALLDLRNILEFVIEVSATIYINQCEQKEIVPQISDLYYELAINRLRLNLLDLGILGPAFEKLVVQGVTRAFSKRILDTALFSSITSEDSYFNRSAEEKDCFKRVVSLVDPQQDLSPAAADLTLLLKSKVMICNVLAAMVLAAHACHDFKTTRPLLEELFDNLDGHGRLWELMGFSVLLSITPPAWTELLEEFTRRLIEDHADIFYGETLSFLTQFDIVLLPLGLAYGKQGRSMPFFEALIQDGLRQGDLRKVKRCLAGLGLVGFYHPKAVFHTLQATISDFADEELQAALVQPLATMRTLHFDAVDIFLGQIGANETFQRQVSAATDVELIRRYIYSLGLYNSAIYDALFHPRMRRKLLMAGLNAFANANSLEEAIVDHALISIRFAREAEYKLSRWTLPEE